MKHPRRLLLLVPFVLLGAALLVRARLPHPTTEGDKWLWEQAETVTSIEVVPSAYTEARRKHWSILAPSIAPLTCDHTTLTDRTSIRTLLRAFKNTPRFRPKAQAIPVLDEGVDTILMLTHKGDAGCFGDGDKICYVRLYQAKGRYYLWRSNKTEVSIDAASVARFQSVFHSALLKAKHHQTGYSTARGTCTSF